MNAKTLGEMCAYPDPHENTLSGAGLTKRELFAAMAMQAAVTAAASWGPLDFGRDIDTEKVSQFASKQGDALLTELAKEQP